ncbi:MAG: AcrB/AcrD/AcrF family protein [Planctomycetota bacterium]|nr:MAG: AcrB/AcrD/AcrF family protein [Planctomycetota bacterium]
MNPIRAAVERPYTVAVGVVLALLFGVLAITSIPVQLKPLVDTPRITVDTNFRGASAVEVEEQVTRELEEVLQTVEGLTEMVSDSSEGRSGVTLEFDYGTDTQLTVVDVINKLSQVQRWPEEADEPVVTVQSGTQTEFVMWIVAHSGMDPDAVRRLIEDDIKARIERVPGVASLFVAGGSPREVQVRIDPDALASRGISVNALLTALSRGNMNVRGGTVETTGRQLVVRTVGRAPQASDLARIVLSETPAGSVLLGDVAEVVDSYVERSGFVRISGTPGVALGVRRQAGVNVIELVDRLELAMDRINDVFAARNIDLWLASTYEETDYIRAAISFVTNNMLLGAGLAVIVLLAFLRSARSVLVVALSIPISLITVFLVFQALGRSLNVISLAGVAFASGMVVDNAIVVLENIFRHMEAGRSPREAAIEGGQEVWGGVLASTLTTVAVFVPILLQSDEASELFADMALAISAAVALSLVVALTVVPVLAALLYRGGAPRTAAREVHADERGIGRLYGRFLETLSASDNNAVAGKLGFTLIVLALALASLKLTPPAEYLPTGNRNMVLFFADPVPGTRTEAIADNLAPLEQFALAQPEVDRMFSVSGPFFNGGGVILKQEYATAEGIADFHQSLYGPASTLAGFRFVVPVRSSLFEDPGKQFEVELSGPDLAGLGAASERLTERLRAVPGVEFVRNSLVTGRPQLTVTVDEHRAKDAGLDVAAVGEVVATLVAGRRVTTLIDAGREVEVNVMAPAARIASARELEAVPFVAPGVLARGLNGELRSTGTRVLTLGSVATVETTIGPQSIRRLERERNVLLTVNIAEDAPLEQVVAAVEETVLPAMARELGPAYTVAVGGSADKLATTLRSLSGGFGLSVLIIYLLLVALFRSWVTPVIILVTVPLALTGGLIGIRVAHELSGGQAAFDVIAMLGFVILAGIVVNNAILIVHQANNFREAGMDARRAIAESARSRLRPILMAAITTVFAMAPLAAGGGAGAELYQGLGAIIVGGLALSTLFTLVLVPVLLSLGQDLSERLGGHAAQPATQPATHPTA